MRDLKDRVIVTEKLDGSNVGVARIGDSIIPLIRAGYHAKDSPHQMHHLFADWVASREQRFRAMLQDGERVAGEWLLLAHGTRYNIASAEHLFVAFDILAHDRRRAYDDLIARCRLQDTITAAVVSDGPAVSVESALMKLGTQGFHDAVERPEGAAWRLSGKVLSSSLPKYMSTDKVDGAFLPEISGGELVWNWPPENCDVRLATKRHGADGAPATRYGAIHRGGART